MAALVGKAMGGKAVSFAASSMRDRIVGAAADARSSLGSTIDWEVCARFRLASERARPRVRLRTGCEARAHAAAS